MLIATPVCVGDFFLWGGGGDGGTGGWGEEGGRRHVLLSYLSIEVDKGELTVVVVMGS